MEFPEQKPPGIPTNRNMDENLTPVWNEIRNSIVRDQDAIYRYLSSIKTNKENIRFMKKRIMSNARALEALESVEGK